MTKEKLAPLLYVAFTVLSLFGVNISPEVRQVLQDNIGVLITTLGGLGAVIPSLIAAFNKKE